MTTSHSPHSPQGFLLLTLNNVEVTLPSATGPIIDQLALECVTVSEDPSSISYERGRDVWLVLRVGLNETVISPTQVVHHVREERIFIFEDGTSGAEPGRKWILKLPAPQTPADIEDIETFEALLSQYTALEALDLNGPPPNYSDTMALYPTSNDTAVSRQKRPVPAPPLPTPSKPGKPPLPPRSTSPMRSSPELYSGDLRGRLTLVDENNGEIVGTLGEQFNIREDSALKTGGHEKDPVIIDIPADSETARMTDVYVYPVPLEQQDTIMKTASTISRGLVFVTNAVTTGMGAASSFFISHSKSNEKPLEFSESTRGHVRRMHNISGKAVEVTAKTTGLIHDSVEHTIDYISGSKDKGKSRVASPVPSDPGVPPRPLPLKTRLFLATDMLLTTVEQSAKELAEKGTLHISEALGHKYGNDMRDATYLVGHSARNVAMVYIDARGVGRRALLKKAGARYLKAKFGSKDVVLEVDQNGVLQQTSDGPSSRTTSPGPLLPSTSKNNLNTQDLSRRGIN